MYSIVTVSPKFQVVISKEVRESLGITAHCKLVMMTKGKNILLVPVDEDIRNYKGFLPKMDLSGLRDHNDRF
ncbi:TPA: AbrB/MazE/SpoVT family DNA-binding domain-containing protein [Candidatus Micrarchaeota archaeon]|nr:AbrB/MazE/SpoVT family DNA-binding domain-containing protein [Candidatus Micrarchaeota archaeon]